MLKQIPFDALQRAYDRVSFGACVEGVLGAFVQEQRLRAFDLIWRWPLLFHVNENGPDADVEKGLRNRANSFAGAVIVDLIYEIYVFRWIYPGQALIVAAIVAFLSYVLIRGLANRIARRWVHRDGEAKGDTAPPVWRP